LHLSILRDTTEEQATREALRLSEALFRAVVEKSSEAISLTSADGSTRYLTASAWSLLGWTAEEMGLRTLREQVLPEDRALLEIKLAQLIQTGGRDMAIDLRVRHRDGSIRWIESKATNLLDNPDVRAIVGNYRDITARKQAEEELKASEARYRRIIDSTSEGVSVTDANLVTTFVNARLASLLGYRVEEMIGQPTLDFVAEEGKELTKSMAIRRRTTRGETHPNVYRKKDGTLILALAKTHAIFSESGEYE